jgi:hypothetical protein
MKLMRKYEEWAGRGQGRGTKGISNNEQGMKKEEEEEEEDI